MFLLGIRLLFLQKVDFKQPKFLYFGLVFLCFWVPILCSMPDAINMAKTASVAGFYSSYFFAGLYIIHTLNNNSIRQKNLLKICTFIIVFWIFDALFQAVVGCDFFGFQSAPGALNGIFGENHPKMGIYLSALCSLAIVFGGRYWSGISQCLIILGSSLSIFLAGRRGGWIMLMVVLIGYTAWLMWGMKKLQLYRVATIVLLLLLVIFGAYQTYSPFKERINTTLLVFNGDQKSIDTSISHRLPIWSVAVRMMVAHPINGVGARDFRYAYREYADENDRYIADASSLGAYYPHQLLLEIGSETGLIGLFGFVVACWLLTCYWLKVNFTEKQTVVPYGLALLAVFFPLNTHYAIYSSHWSSFVFWLLALFLSGSCPNE